MNDSQQFGQLRARLEAAFPASAVIVISSARRGDGKTVTAFGLAESFAQADHRVLYVDMHAQAPTLPRLHRLPNLGSHAEFSRVCRYVQPVAGQQFAGVSFADDRLDVGLSLEKIKAAIADMRSNFDYIIVDTAPLNDSEAAVLFATLADGVLLTLRTGRMPSASDSVTIKTLNRVGANVMGVFTVTSSAIRNFANLRKNAVPSLAIPVRHVTSRHSIDGTPAREVVETSRGNAVS